MTVSQNVSLFFPANGIRTKCSIYQEMYRQHY